MPGRFLDVVGFFTIAFIISGCRVPDEEIQLKQIRDVVADASSDPLLKAEAVFFNPNSVSGRLKNIDVEIFVNGKLAGSVKKEYHISIPANGEFTVPLEVKLNLKELGTLETLLGMLGGRKLDVKYLGDLRVKYRGIPITVPVDYKSELKVRL